jgi:hypothetical protein
MTNALPPRPRTHTEYEEARDDDKIWNVTVELAGDPAPRIEPGEYQARVVDRNIRTLFKTRRLVLVLEIVQSKAAGTRLEFIAQMPANAGAKSKFTRAWEVANGAPPKRRERMSLVVFRHRLFLVAVRDVQHDRMQRKLARPYSIVDSILERLA